MTPGKLPHAQRLNVQKDEREERKIRRIRRGRERWRKVEKKVGKNNVKN